MPPTRQRDQGCIVFIYDLVVRGQAAAGSSDALSVATPRRSTSMNTKAGPIAVLDEGADAVAMVGGRPAVADWDAHALWTPPSTLTVTR